MLLEDVKAILRIDGNDLDTEVDDLIEAAKLDLFNAGININKTITITESMVPEATEEVPNPEPIVTNMEVIDPLLKRAIITYCKAYFGYDDTTGKFEQSYISLKQHLSLSQEYMVGEDG
ncbi:MAG: head-tail connector protein [Peptostreptococcales bacterium]